jgi:hypothetical protein
LQVVRSTDVSASEEIMSAAAGRYSSSGSGGGGGGGGRHPDIDLVSPIYCPIIVVGNKMDLLKDREPVERRAISQALRFMCHQAGASFITCSSKDKNSQSNYRSLMTSHLFASSSSSSSGKTKREVNADKPMIVPIGSDTFEDILKNLPKGADRSDFIGTRVKKEMKRNSPIFEALSNISNGSLLKHLLPPLLI